jgi:hypothetical protein
MLRLYPASASWITQFCPTRPPLRSEHFGGAAEAGTAVTTLEKPTKTAAVAARTDVGMRIDEILFDRERHGRRRRHNIQAAANRSFSVRVDR